MHTSSYKIVGKVKRKKPDELSVPSKQKWRRKWQPTPVFLPRESQGQGSLVGCQLWGCTDLIDRVPDELWTEVQNIVQEAVIKTIPKKCKKAKQLSEEALQIDRKSVV